MQLHKFQNKNANGNIFIFSGRRRGWAVSTGPDLDTGAILAPTRHCETLTSIFSENMLIMDRGLIVLWEPTAQSLPQRRVPTGTEWAKHLLEQTSLCLRQECELLLFPGVHNVTHIKPEHLPYRPSQALEWNRKWRLPAWQWHQFSPRLNNISFLSFSSSYAKQGRDYYETQVRLCWLYFNNHLALHTNYSHSGKYDCVRSPEN